MLRDDDSQTTLLGLDEPPPVPRKRRATTRRQMRPTRTYAKEQLPLGLAPKEHIASDEYGPGPCQGRPGICLVFRCRENLALDVADDGAILIPAVPGISKRVSLPIKRTNKRNVTAFDLEAAADAAILRSEWLEEVAGSNCARDIIREHEDGMKLIDIGRLMGVSRERARQICEAGAERTRGTHTRELQQTAPMVQIRRRTKEQP